MAKIFPIIISVLFGVIAGFSLLHEGLIPTHDGEYHVVRFFIFNEAFNDGNLYPRWAAHLNNGFGVPLFTFVYPLPNYIAVFLHVFGIGFIDSFRIEMFVAILVGSTFFYLWAKEFWGRLGGIVSSIFYTFSPYHFVDIYIRGSIGEVWALAFFPAFLWTYTVFVKSNKKVFLVLSSLFLALIILSHNILALMFFLFSLSYAVILIYKKKNNRGLILNTLYLLLLGLGLSAIFWLPAIYETKYVTGLQIFDIAAHFPQLYQLLIPSWGSGFSGGELQNELSFQIGIANIIAVLISLIVVLLRVKNKDNKSFYILFFLGWFVFIFFLMLDVSKSIWQTIPFMKYFQFPWRLLSLEILFASFLAGSLFSVKINWRIRIIFAALFIFLALSLGIGYTKPAYYHYRNDNYYISRSNFINGTNSPGNVFNTIYFRNIPKEKERATFLQGEGKITLTEEKSNVFDFEITTDADSKVLVNAAYYPGWNVYVNNKKTDVTQTNDGRFSFIVERGRNDAKVIFEDTLLRKFSTLTSFTSMIILLVLFTKYKSSKI